MLRLIQIIIETEVMLGAAFAVFGPYGALIGTAIMMMLGGIALERFTFKVKQRWDESIINGKWIVNKLKKKQKQRIKPLPKRQALTGNRAKAIGYCGERRHPSYSTIITPNRKEVK